MGCLSNRTFLMKGATCLSRLEIRDSPTPRYRWGILGATPGEGISFLGIVKPGRARKDMAGIGEGRTRDPGTPGMTGIVDGRIGIEEDPPRIGCNGNGNGPVDKAVTPGIWGSLGIDGRSKGFKLKCFCGNVGENPGTLGIEGSTGSRRLCRILGTFLDW